MVSLAFGSIPSRRLRHGGGHRFKLVKVARKNLPDPRLIDLKVQVHEHVAQPRPVRQRLSKLIVDDVLFPGGSEASITTSTVATNVLKKSGKTPPPSPYMIGIR